MRATLKDGMLIVVVDNKEELAAFSAWRAGVEGHVFALTCRSDKGAVFHDLGPRDEACRAPLNIVFDRCEPRWQPISNLALAPFVLDGHAYNSVEGFWQGLKFDADEDRTRVAALWGKAAKRAAATQIEQPSFCYRGETLASGAHGHQVLMLRACRAKFAQNEAARAALLATGERHLVHRPRRDSKTIPGALMADIWMRIRAELRKTGALPVE